jgi:hypothetical protein
VDAEDLMAYLEIRIAQDVCRVSLDRDRLRIGRLAGNDIVLHDAQISRQHAELRLMGSQWRILDLGSTNGLHIKGKRIPEHPLANGDLLLLAPDVSLRFYEGAAPPDAISTSTSHAAVAPAGPSPAAPPVAQQVGPPASPRPAPSPSVAPSSAEPPMLDMFRPRSPFADDEQPYYPAGMGAPAPPTHYHSQYAPGAATNGQQPSYQPPTAPRSPSQYDTLPAGGYPAPVGPMTSGNDGHDPFRRSGVSGPMDANRATAGPTSTLLHVCQTCGQLTAPDSVYCQNCHHSIARECVNCRLSLLPIQDRCPRCQAPNPMSVRRAHRAAGA